MSDTRVWYYAANNEKIGPLQKEDLEKLVSSGVIVPETLVWAEGMKCWALAKIHFNFLAAQPPELSLEQTVVQPTLPQLSPPFSTEVAAQSGVNDNLGNDGLYIGSPSRGFVDAISICLKKYATFTGRASRSEYWYFILFTVLVGLVSAALDSILYRTEEYEPINAIASLVILLPTLAVSCRRLHDVNRSGWWIGAFWIAWLVIVLILLVSDPNRSLAELIYVLFGLGALVYAVIVLIFFCSKGNLKKNQFG